MQNYETLAMILIVLYDLKTADWIHIFQNELPFDIRFQHNTMIEEIKLV